jgi:hypothetical protein
MAKAAEVEVAARAGRSNRLPSKIEKMREEARKKTPEPILNPASRSSRSASRTRAWGGAELSA